MARAKDTKVENWGRKFEAAAVRVPSRSYTDCIGREVRSDIYLVSDVASKRKAKDTGGMSPSKVDPDHSSFAGRFAARLRLLRERAGLTPEKAALAITKAGYKVSAPTIYRWEQGNSAPHIEAFPAIAEAYQMKTVRTLLPDDATVSR